MFYLGLSDLQYAGVLLFHDPLFGPIDADIDAALLFPVVFRTAADLEPLLELLTMANFLHLNLINHVLVAHAAVNFVRKDEAAAPIRTDSGRRSVSSKLIALALVCLALHDLGPECMFVLGALYMCVGASWAGRSSFSTTK